MTGLNLQTVSAPQRFVISSDSFHHSGANIVEAEVDSFSMPSAPVITATTAVTLTANLATVTKEKIIEPSLLFIGFASAGGTDPAMGCFANLSENVFFVGGIRTIIISDTDLQKVAARQMSLSAEVSMHAEYNIKEKRRLASVVEEKNQLLKSKDEEIKNLKAQLLLKEAKAVDSKLIYLFKISPDLAGKPVNDTLNRGMIGSLMYLTITRPDIQFSIVVCARYQFNLKESRLIDVKRILRKSTSGACQILGGKLVCWSAKKQQSVAISSTEAKFAAAGDYIFKRDIELHFIPTEYQVLGGNYSSTEQVNSIQQLLAYSLITGTEVDIGKIINSVLDPSKVTNFELTAHMIVVNNRRDSVSPPPFTTKIKKGNSQTVISTSPNSQGPEASGSLSKKSKSPMSKKPLTETKVTPPKPTEGSDQSHSVSLGTVPDPQDLERDIQLASMLLPSTLDEGTCKSKPFLRGQILRGNKPPTDMEPQNPTNTNLSWTGAKYKEDQTQFSRLRYQSLTRNEGLLAHPLILQSLRHNLSQSSILNRVSHKEREKVIDDQTKDQKKLVKASSIVHPDEPDKEEDIKKAKEEAKLDAISKTEVIKIVREEAIKLGINLKEAITTKAGELFRKPRMLNMRSLKDNTLRRLENLLSSESIIYRGTDGRNFDVYKPFLFGAFGRSKLDELREIIPKKKNTMPALPPPEQASSQTLGRKRKHMELDLQIRILGLECNRTLLENASFVNNMDIKEPDYGIFFTGEFGDQAFQRWSDIDKVGMEAYVSYLVAASMVKYLRQKCTQACVFAAYFPPDQPAKFANVHKVFGASRVAKILDKLSTSQREDAVNSLAFEVDAHLKDPVYGSASLIRVLQHILNQAKFDLHSANHKLATYMGPSAMMPTLPQAQLGQMGVIGPSAMMPNWTQLLYASMQPLIGRIRQVGRSGTPSNMLLDPQQQHLYEAQLVDVSDPGFAPLASVNEVNFKNKGWMSFKMDLLSFIRTADPTKVRFGERQRGKDEPKILETTIGRVVLLLSDAPTRSSGKLEANVDKLFDEGGSAKASKEKENHCCWGGPIPTLPFVTSSVSATLKHEGEGHTDSVTRLDLQTVSTPQRPFAPVIKATIAVTLVVDPAAVTKEKIIKPFLLSVGSASAGGTDPAMGCFADLSSNDFLVGGIRTVISLDKDLQKMSLSVEVSMHAEYNIKEKRRLTSIVEEKNQLPKSRDEEIKNLKAQLLLKEAKAADSIHLCAEASKFKDIKRSLQEKVSAYKNCTEQLEKFQDEQMKVVNDKFDKLYTDFIEMALHLEERLYPYLLTTIVGRRWLLTYGIEIDIAKYLNLSEYLSDLGAAIGKVIEKGMQDGLAAGITHGKEKCELLFLAELKLNKDSSVETLMNILCLEETLVERLGLNESQQHVDQLMVPFHHSPDQTVIGATSLSLSLDVSHARVQNIRENIANYKSAICDIFIPLAGLFFIMDLEGTGFTSVTVPATADTTMAFSMNANDFSVDLAKNLFRLASFSFKFYTSFKHFMDRRLSTTFTLSRHTFNPLALNLYPRNIPSSTPKEMFIISAGFQLKMSKLQGSNPHNLLRPSSVRRPLRIPVDPTCYLNASSAFIVQWESFFFMHFFKVLKNANDFSVDLAKNLFRIASFSFKFYTSFKHFMDRRLSTAFTLSRHTFNLLALNLYPRNIPSSTPKAMFIISAGFQLKMSKLQGSNPHNLLWPSSVRRPLRIPVDPTCYFLRLLLTLPPGSLAFYELSTELLVTF
nr:LOB domain-containing protein 36-like [Tanacetum cinerariifolium]